MTERKQLSALDVTTEFVPSFDGTRLAVHRLAPSSGSPRPVLLLHGLFSSAQMNWIRFGHAQLLVEAGFTAIMPEWRAHGESDAPRVAAAYPADVLVRDAFSLVEALELTDYDLVGFSLGARTAVAAVIEGLRPRRLVIAGMGMQGLFNWEKRAAFFIDMIDRYDTIERGDRAWFAKSFFKTMGMDRVATRLLLSEGVADIDRAGLVNITMPTLVLTGAEDRDNGSPTELANALPDARYQEVPGDHMSSVAKPDMGRAIRDFLSAQ